MWRQLRCAEVIASVLSGVMWIFIHYHSLYGCLTDTMISSKTLTKNHANTKQSLSSVDPVHVGRLIGPYHVHDMNITGPLLRKRYGSVQTFGRY